MVCDLTYKVREAVMLRDKAVLHQVSAQFDWGKMNLILGAKQSGKTSLLHVIAGSTGVGSEVSGSVLFNGKEANIELALWERCGFVLTHNEHIRDLTVLETLTFALKLRCRTKADFAAVSENVKVTLEQLQLTE